MGPWVDLPVRWPDRSKPLVSPYPPDLADDQPPMVDFGDLVDAVVVTSMGR